MRYFLILFSLFVSIFFVYVANGLLITSTGLTLGSMGASSFEIGFINTAYLAGLVLGTIINGSFISRVGHARSFSFFIASYILALLLHQLTTQVWQWSILRLIIGFSVAGAFMIVESWLNARAKTKVRGKIISIYSMSSYIAYALSAYILSMELAFSNLIIIIGVLAAASIIPVSLTKIKQPTLPKATKLSLPKVVGIVPLALLAAFLGGIATNAFYTMASVYVVNHGYGAKEVSIFIACAVIGAFLVQLPLGKFSDKVGRRPAMIVVAIITIIAASFATIFYKFMLIQYVAAFFLGTGMFAFYSLGLARANDVMPKGFNNMEISRAILLAYGVGSVISPILMGIVLGYIGNFSFMLVFAALGVILLVYAIKQDTIPEERREEFSQIAEFSTLASSDADAIFEQGQQEGEENWVEYDKKAGEAEHIIFDESFGSENSENSESSENLESSENQENQLNQENAKNQEK